MSLTDLRIDAYLDALARELRVDPAHARRILIEVEDHLRETARAGIDGGLDEEAAVARAIAGFGAPRLVARRFHAEQPLRPTLTLLLQLVLALGLLGGVGLTSIGVSGGVAAAFGSAFGKGFVAADAPGVTYTPQRCAEYRALAPGARDCNTAAIDHHFDEIVTYRLAVGVLGLLSLAGCWLVRRKLRRFTRARVLPNGFTEIAGAALFGVAALALLAGAVGPGNNGGQLSGAVVSAFVFLYFGRGLLHTLRTTPA